MEIEPNVNECKQILVILDQQFFATVNTLINYRNRVMNLSFGNVTLELNMFNMCKWPHHQEDYDNENEEIDIIEPIIEEHIEDENFTNSIEICFAGFFESSKELNCDTANICSILDYVQVPISDDDQSNFEDITQSEEPNENEAPELELKPLPEELKYAYIREHQTYPVIISSQLTHDQECKLLFVLKRHKTAFSWTLKDINGINRLICIHQIHLEKNAKTTRQPQRRLNPHMKEVVKNEILKLLDIGIIYHISYNRWVNPTQVV